MNTTTWRLSVVNLRMTDQDGGDAPQYGHFEIVKRVGLSNDAASELAGELNDGEFGLVEDHSYDGYYYIVRWHIDE